MNSNLSINGTFFLSLNYRELCRIRTFVKWGESSVSPESPTSREYTIHSFSLTTTALVDIFRLDKIFKTDFF